MKTAKLLTINLSKESYAYQNVNLELIGGRGFACEYYAGSDEENPIVIASSRFSQSSNKAAGRFSIAYNAPLYDRYRCSTVRGRFGGGMQSLGLDLIAVHGEFKDEEIVIIQSGAVEFSHDLKAVGQDMPYIKIGESGTNLSPIATVCDETGRQFGTGGLGAVFGGKKLKMLGIIPNNKPTSLALPVGISCSRCKKLDFCEKTKGQSIADKFFVDNSIFKTLAKQLNVRDSLELEKLAEELSLKSERSTEALNRLCTTYFKHKQDNPIMTLADCLGLCGFAAADYVPKPEDDELVQRILSTEQRI